jgi:hypothetical protein
MTLPFVLVAFFAGPFLGWVARHRALMGHVEKAMGVMLILFGILIATNSVNLHCRLDDPELRLVRHVDLKGVMMIAD